MAKYVNITTFDYDDVRLLPKESIVTSRSLVDTTVKLGEHVFNLPVIPANMSTVIDEKLAVWLATHNYFYIMHRFDVDPIAFNAKMKNLGLVSSISLGIQDIDFTVVEKFKKLSVNEQPDFITVDVAHGHTEKVANIVSFVKERLPNTFVIAGNVATVEGALFLEKAGADFLKVGVGPGLACLTAPNTGFGTQKWQLSAVQEISEKLSTAGVIADGGIREYGDIAKSLAFGADMIMVGGMLSGHEESPGETIVQSDGTKVKVFFGSASEHQKGESRYVEGKKLFVPYRGSINETLRTIKENLQSSVSYAGGTKLDDLQDVEYVLVDR